MKELLDLHELREYTLLSLLFEEERWMIVEELMEKLKCSKNVIYRATKSLNSFFIANGNELEISSQKGKGLLLKKYSDTTLTKYKSIYIQNCTSFKIIDIIFRNPDITVDELANQLYFSTTTAYRKISMVEIFLNNNGLSLTKNKLNISGNTALIREFMYHLYWSISASGFWPFPSVSKDAIEYRLNSSLQKLDPFFSESEKFQIIYRFSVYLIHYQQKNFISEEISFGLVDPISKKYLSLALESLLENLPQSVKAFEQDYLSSIFCSYPVANETHLDQSSIVEWHKKNKTLAYQLTSEFLNDLQIFYVHENLIENSNLMYQFICISIYSLSFPTLFSVPNELKKLLDWFIDYNYYYYTTIKNICINLHKKRKYKGKLIVPDYFLYNSLIILTNFYTIQKWDISLNIGIHSSQGSINENLLKGQLLSHFKDCITITTNTDILHSKKTLESFDLIISDRTDLITSSSFPKEKTFNWSFPPTETEWANLEEKLKYIKLQKSTYLDDNL